MVPSAQSFPAALSIICLLRTPFLRHHFNPEVPPLPPLTPTAPSEPGASSLGSPSFLRLRALFSWSVITDCLLSSPDSIMNALKTEPVLSLYSWSLPALLWPPWVALSKSLTLTGHQSPLLSVRWPQKSSRPSPAQEFFKLSTWTQHLSVSSLVASE